MKTHALLKRACVVSKMAGNSVSLQRSSFRDIHTNCNLLLAVEYAISFSGRRDALKGPTLLTDTHRKPSLRMRAEGTVEDMHVTDYVTASAICIQVQDSWM